MNLFCSSLTLGGSFMPLSRFSLTSGGSFMTLFDSSLTLVTSFCSSPTLGDHFITLL